MSTNDQVCIGTCALCQEEVEHAYLRWDYKRHRFVCDNCTDEPAIIITGQDDVEVVELPGIGDE